jgi:hypothetical protein
MSPNQFHEAIPLREKTAALARTKTADHQAMFGQERSNSMKLKVQQIERGGKCLVRETPTWRYHGPFADEAAAHAFVQQKKVAWKATLRNARANRKAMAALTAEAALATEQLS